MAGVWIEVGNRRMKVELTGDGAALVEGAPYAVDLQELEPGVLSLLWIDATGRVKSYRCAADEGSVVVDGERIEVATCDPRSLRAGGAGTAASGPKPLKAPMPGRVVRVLVSGGDTVDAGQGCIVIEAMKMQNELKAPKAGLVRKLAAQVGETVAAGAVLLVVE
jgi:biotin carboxyl carrier protein